MDFGLIIAFVSGVVLGVACAWRYWREKYRQK